MEPAVSPTVSTAEVYGRTRLFPTGLHDSAILSILRLFPVSTGKRAAIPQWRGTREETHTSSAWCLSVDQPQPTTQIPRAQSISFAPLRTPELHSTSQPIQLLRTTFPFRLRQASWTSPT